MDIENLSKVAHISKQLDGLKNARSMFFDSGIQSATFATDGGQKCVAGSIKDVVLNMNGTATEIDLLFEFINKLGDMYTKEVKKL